MRKLLILLGSLALAISPVLTIESCGSLVIKKPHESVAATAAAASLKTLIYQKLLENYNDNQKDMSKHVGDDGEIDDGYDYKWLSFVNMKNKFADLPDNIYQINLLQKKLNDSEKSLLTKDLEYILDLGDLATSINDISTDKSYDIIDSQTNKVIFRSWAMVPISLSRIISDEDPTKPLMLQFSFSMAVNYQVFLNGSVQNLTSDKINGSFTLTTSQVFFDLTNWVSSNVGAYLYTASDSTLRIKSDSEPFYLSNPSDWEEKLNNFKRDFNSNIADFFATPSLWTSYIAKKLEVIFDNTKDYGFKPKDGFENMDFSINEIDPLTILTGAEITQPAMVYGKDIDYSSNINRINVLNGSDEAKANKDIIDLAFGAFSLKKDETKMKRASVEYADLNKDVLGLNPSSLHPLNSDEFYNGYSSFIKNFGISLEGNDTHVITDPIDKHATINIDNIYSYGHVSLEPIDIEFKAYSGTLKLNLNLPWSFSLHGSGSDDDVDRKLSTMSYFIALEKWKQNLNVKYFQQHWASEKDAETSFMTLNTFDRSAGTDYSKVDPNFYDNGYNDRTIYNMLLDMDSTVMGSASLNLDQGTIAKSDAWDSLIGKYSRNGTGFTQYYFEKYAGLLPDDETPDQWKNQQRLSEENGSVYWGIHYDTADNGDNPSLPVSIPFTQRLAANNSGSASENKIPLNWHAKIRHEQDEDYNDNNLVYTLAMGNYGVLNLSFPSFNATEDRYKAGGNLEILVIDTPFSIWNYLWNPHSSDGMVAMRIIADDLVKY